MTTTDLITELFCPIDDRMKLVPKHPQASLWPSEVVTLGMLSALKGVGSRAFYRWLLRDCRELFPHLPSRTRLFRLQDVLALDVSLYGAADPAGCDRYLRHRVGASLASRA